MFVGCFCTNDVFLFFADVDLTHTRYLAYLGVCVQVVDATAIAEGSRANVISLPSSNKDDGRVELPPPNRFAAALCGVLGDSALDGTFANALLIAHHPLVCHSAKGAKSVWGGIGRRAFGGEDGIDHLLQDEGIVASVTARLVSAMQGQVQSDRCTFVFLWRTYQYMKFCNCHFFSQNYHEKTNRFAMTRPCCKDASPGFLWSKLLGLVLGRFLLSVPFSCWHRIILSSESDVYIISYTWYRRIAEDLSHDHCSTTSPDREYVYSSKH